MGAPLKVVLLGDLVVANLHRLRAKADFPFEAVTVPDAMPAPGRAAAVMAADAAVATAFSVPATGSPTLRLVQVQGAGWERVDLACLPGRAAVCNAFGHVRAAAEYALMTMLMWTHRWKDVEDSFRGGSWKWSGAAGGPFRHELNSRTVGVVGLGSMGRELCNRIAAMGVRILGCGRTRPADLRSIDRFFPLEQIDPELWR